jgi:RluA family pseudouridine synthase
MVVFRERFSDSLSPQEKDASRAFTASGQAKAMSTRKPRANQQGEKARSSSSERRRPLDLLFEDDRCLVVAKPPGLLTVAPPATARGDGPKEPTLVDRLKEQGVKAWPVHRIDRETSGVVLCAKDQEARALLMDEFKQRRVDKTYLAIVFGHLRKSEGVLAFPIKDLGAHAIIAPNGQPAETRYRLLRRLGPASLLEVQIMTGRHNQIRLHFAHLGHPLLGERKYARGSDAPIRHKRAALHASRIAWMPISGEARVSVEAPLPLDLNNLIHRLEGLSI